MNTVTLVVNLKNREAKNIPPLINALSSRLNGASVTCDELTLTIGDLCVVNKWDLIYRMQVVKGSLKDGEKVLYVVVTETTTTYFTDQQILDSLLGEDGLVELPENFDLKSPMIRFLVSHKNVKRICGGFHGVQNRIHPIYMVKTPREIMMASDVGLDPSTFWWMAFSAESIAALNGDLIGRLTAVSVRAQRGSMGTALNSIGWASGS